MSVHIYPGKLCLQNILGQAVVSVHVNEFDSAMNYVFNFA